LNTDSNGDYRTKNTAFAAYLRTEGFKLLDVEINNYTPAVFIFENDKQISSLERSWNMGETTGNLCSFFESYRLCLRMVRIGKL
jgi:hypothetical protein